MENDRGDNLGGEEEGGGGEAVRRNSKSGVPVPSTRPGRYTPNWKVQSKVLSSEQLIIHAQKTHAELLQEVTDIGFDVAKGPFSNKYVPQADEQLQQSYRRVEQEEQRVALDTGPTISKERFSQNYWRVWNEDIVLLEEMSRKDVQASKDAIKELMERKRKEARLKQLEKGMSNSRLPGTTFATPKSNTHEYFDLHQMGKNNEIDFIYVQRHSTLPASLVNPSMLVGAANVDPDSSDRVFALNRIRGGVINTGPARGVEVHSLTKSCDVMEVFNPKGSPKFTSFSTGPRFFYASDGGGGGGGGGASGGGGGSASVSAAPPPQIEKPQMGGFKFGFEERGKDTNTKGKGVPGPGTYNLDLKKHKPRDLDKLVELIANQDPDFRSISAENLAKLVGFAFGCNRQEHILYGRCLDNMCGKRALYEIGMLQTRDYVRIGAPNRDSCLECVPGLKQKKKKASNSASSSSLLPIPSFFAPPTPISRLESDTQRLLARVVEAEGTSPFAAPLTSINSHPPSPQKTAERDLRREFIDGLVPPAIVPMYPLHLAAAQGDCNAIERMINLGSDVNLQQGDHNDTPLHLAVRHGRCEAILALISVFEKIIKVDVQNAQGDTPLHLACREGHKDIAEVLCDAGASPRIKNNADKVALQESAIYSIQQVIRLQEDKFLLQDELDEVKDERAQVAKKIEQRKKQEQSKGFLETFLETGAEERAYTAASSRQSSRASSRSRLLELHPDKFDADEAKYKTNKALYRVSRTQTLLKNPKFNSYSLGYFAETAEVEK